MPGRTFQVVHNENSQNNKKLREIEKRKKIKKERVEWGKKAPVPSAGLGGAAALLVSRAPAAQ